MILVLVHLVLVNNLRFHGSHTYSFYIRGKQYPISFLRFFGFLAYANKRHCK